MAISVILLIVLITLNGFFAGSEIAFISINERKLKAMKEEGHEKAKLVLKLKEIPNKFLSTIQIGVSIASILSGVFASEAFANVLTDWILNFINLPMGAVKTFSMFFITLITSYLMLLFGELVPKRMAMANPQKFSFTAVYPLSLLATVATPIIKILSFSTNLVLKVIGINTEDITDEVTEEEIRVMVEEGKIDHIEKEMIESVFEFDDTEVSEIMTHRTRLIAIDWEEDLDTILDIINEERFTRYPVYKDNIDNIIGVIHSRELLRYLGRGEKEDFDIDSLLIKPYFVPDSKRTNELFREMQIKKIHMAIVIDEHGGTAGIVTMENLVEEIMGDILDEYDEKRKDEHIVSLNSGEYIVDGSCSIEDLEETLNIGLPTGRYKTVSGFIIGHLGKIPRKKDIKNHESDFVFNGYLFSIVSLERKVISEVKITKKDKNNSGKDKTKKHKEV